MTDTEFQAIKEWVKSRFPDDDDENDNERVRGELKALIAEVERLRGIIDAAKALSGVGWVKEGHSNPQDERLTTSGEALGKKRGHSND